MGITVKQRGNWKRTTRFLKEAEATIEVVERTMQRYANRGLEALRAATPVDTGKTRDSWTCEVTATKKRVTLSFWNTNIQNGVPIAIILQYGHGTRNGGWVQGRDYVNPAIGPIFDEIAKEAWEELTG